MTDLDRWSAAGYAHTQVLTRCEDSTERLRMLSSAPLFSLWSDCRREMEDAASEIERLRIEVRRLEIRVRSLEGEDA